MQQILRSIQNTTGWFLVVVLCLVYGAALCPIPAPVLAQGQPQPAVQIQVMAGYNEQYRVSHWFPITVIASNTGPDIQGILEWQFTGIPDSTTFKRVVDLPRGAQKRLSLHAFATNFARAGEVRLVVNGAVVGRQRVRLNPIDAEQYVIGVVSSDPALLNSLEVMQFNNHIGTTVTHLTPDLLPEEAITLAGIDALFLHDLPTADLTPAQYAALELWVYQGGQLVVSGGTNAERTTPGLTELLPVTVGDLRSAVSLETLGKFAPRERESMPPNATVSQVTIQPDARALDDAALLVARNRGEGQVIFSAFDFTTLRAWIGEPTLWSRVLKSTANFEPGTLYRWREANLVREVIQFPGLQLPSFGILVIFILVYIVVIGPLNFIILRRMRRSEWAWGTIPVIVLLFVVGTYSAGALIRGNQFRIMQVTLVQGYEQTTRGQATGFVGLFSPGRDTYTLTFPPEALVSHERFGWDNSAYAPVVWTDQGTELRDLLVDVSSLRTAIVEQAVDVPFRISSDLERQRGDVTGTVQNLGDTPLVDAVLVYGSSQESLGTLEPGARRDISLERNRGTFPPPVLTDSSELLDQRRVLNALFQGDQFGPFPVGPNPPMRGMPDRDGVYLLAWRDQPLIETRVNGSAVTQAGITLYIIRLDG